MMTQDLNTPMTPVDIPDDAWREDDESSPPGASDDEAFVQAINQGKNPLVGDKPEPPEMGYTDVTEVVLPVPVEHPVVGRLERAEIRELNGEDEEYLAKGRARHDRINRLVERGTVSLDGEDVDEKVVQALPIGSRDALMLAIRRATYGDELDLDLSCGECRALNEVTVDLANEIEVRTAEPEVTVKLRRGGEAVVRWPTVGDEAAVRNAMEKNKRISGAEVNTRLLGRVLVSLNGAPTSGEVTAKTMSMADRSDIVRHLDENMAGPQLSSVTHKCKECGAEAPLIIGYEELFR